MHRPFVLKVVPKPQFDVGVFGNIVARICRAAAQLNGKGWGNAVDQ